ASQDEGSPVPEIPVSEFRIGGSGIIATTLLDGNMSKSDRNLPITIDAPLSVVNKFRSRGDRAILAYPGVTLESFSRDANAIVELSILSLVPRRDNTILVQDGIVRVVMLISRLWRSGHGEEEHNNRAQQAGICETTHGTEYLRLNTSKATSAIIDMRRTSIQTPHVDA